MSESRTVRGAAEFDIDAATAAALRKSLPATADEVIRAVILEVPSYAGALAGRMGTTIRRAVRTALGTFLDVVGGTGVLAVGAEAAYELGRGEARDGRTMDALLAAYRVGARVAWRGLSSTALSAGLPADLLAKFAELVFAYIDELSAASAAGHADELATSGRARERYLEQLGRDLLAGATDEVLVAAADRADWKPPETLTAVLLPSGHAHMTQRLLPEGTLLLAEDAAGLAEPTAVLLVPDASRPHLLRVVGEHRAVVGPARPWTRVAASFARAVRAHALRGDGPLDTEERLVELVVGADVEAHADLRARALSPLDSLRPATRRRLEETLRSWLLHQGRRDDVAAELFVHAQTVRYRMSQLRELFGAALDDPRRVLELTIALAVPAG